MNELARRMARGEAAAFAECYDTFADRLYRYLLARLGSAHDASDVLQNVFVRLVQHRAHLAKVENLATYLFRMAHNEAVRHAARHAPPVATTTNRDVPEQDEEVHVDAADLALVALKRLPAAARDVVHLKLYADCTFQEIARILEIPPGTAATRYRQALSELREWVIREKLL